MHETCALQGALLPPSSKKLAAVSCRRWWYPSATPTPETSLWEQGHGCTAVGPRATLVRRDLRPRYEQLSGHFGGIGLWCGEFGSASPGPAGKKHLLFLFRDRQGDVGKRQANGDGCAAFALSSRAPFFQFCRFGFAGPPSSQAARLYRISRGPDRGFLAGRAVMTTEAQASTGSVGYFCPSARKHSKHLRRQLWTVGSRGSVEKPATRGETRISTQVIGTPLRHRSQPDCSKTG